MTRAFEEALRLAAKINPELAANNCGFRYAGEKGSGAFEFDFLNKTVRLEFPSFKSCILEENTKISDFLLTIILYHLAKSDGFPLADEWISYANLPGGLSYVDAFRGYTSKILIKHFDNKLEDIIVSAKALGLKELDLSADAAFLFPVLPKVPIAFLYRLGDEEFPPYADFLFDKSAPHHLPSDCYAVMCSWLSSCLIKGKWLI